MSKVPVVAIFNSNDDIDAVIKAVETMALGEQALPPGARRA